MAVVETSLRDRPAFHAATASLFDRSDQTDASIPSACIQGGTNCRLNASTGH
jgi:hypothetical protein